jgi:protein required for attachment to host cells
MKPARTWVLVADGARANVYERNGAGALSVVEGMAVHEHHPPSRDLGADKPSRAFESTGSRRSAMQPRQDLHETAEERFLKDTAERVEAAFDAMSFEKLILVAPQKALGILRNVLPKKLIDITVAQFPNDMTKANVKAIEELLATA